MISTEERELLETLARNNMNVTKSARELHYHRNSFLYRLGKIKERTGENPLDFYGLAALLRYDPQLTALLKELVSCGSKILDIVNRKENSDG